MLGTSRFVVRAAVGAALILLAGTAPAATASFTGTAVTGDSTLYSNVPTHNAGGTDRFRAGRTIANGNRRAVIRFDTSSLSPGATITSVSLTLLIAEVPSAGPASTPQALHRI